MSGPCAHPAGRMVACCLLGALLTLSLFHAFLPAQALHQPDRLARARQLISVGKYEAAQNELEDLLRISKDSIPAQAYYYLALCHLKLGAGVKAKNMLNAFELVLPGSVEAAFLRSHLLFRTGRYEEALPLIRRYIEYDPKFGEAYKILGMTQFMLGRVEAAELELTRASKLNPRDWESIYYLGRLYFERGDLHTALATFQKVLAIDPYNVKAHNGLGETYTMLTRFHEAEKAYLKAIELERQQTIKSEWPYFNLGVLYRAQGRTQEALVYLRQALTRNPKGATGKAKLAAVLIDAGKYDEALKELGEAVEIDPDNRESRYRLAKLLTRMGRLKEAKRQYVLFEKLGE